MQPQSCAQIHYTVDLLASGVRPICIAHKYNLPHEVTPRNLVGMPVVPLRRLKQLLQRLESADGLSTVEYQNITFVRRRVQHNHYLYECISLCADVHTTSSRLNTAYEALRAGYTASRQAHDAEDNDDEAGVTLTPP